MKLRNALAAVSLLALTACATPTPLRYYTLSAAQPPTHGSTGIAPDYRIAIGPVSLPESLDRPHILLRVTANRYALAENDRWAEPLKREIPRVVAERIGEQLPAALALAHAQYSGPEADYRVLIDVLRFEMTPGVSAALDVLWTLQKRGAGRLWQARSAFVEPVRAPGVAALVDAQKLALARLSDEITGVLKARAKPD